MILIVLLLGAFGADRVQQQQRPACSGIELVRGEEEYNRLICEGKALLERGLYAEATKPLQAASNLYFPHVPNYKVLALLAKAHLLAGDRQKGEEILQVARMSLSVLAQVVRCSDSGSSPITLVSGGRSLTSQAATAAAQRMCGGAYEPYYEARPSLDAFMRDAEIIQEFLRVQAEFAKR
jgi:hypothetical protein